MGHEKKPSTTTPVCHARNCNKKLITPIQCSVSILFNSSLLVLTRSVVLSSEILCRAPFRVEPQLYSSLKLHTVSCAPWSAGSRRACGNEAQPRCDR